MSVIKNLEGVYMIRSCLPVRVIVVTNRVKRYVNGFKIMIEPLLELGYEVVWAADFKGFKEDLKLIPCEIRQINFRSNPFNFNNLIAYYQLKNLIEEKPVEIIHCNTPIGGLLGRICASNGVVNKVIYTAHGFHFYHGAPFINRTLFKAGEKFLAKKTDVLLTINSEDYEAAKSFSLRNEGKLFLTHGAGINVDQKLDINISAKRREMGIPSDAMIIYSAGEINKNKNNKVIINALAKIGNSNLFYVICGEGKLVNELKSLAQSSGLSERVKFLGYRTDVLEILQASDIFVMPSLREGLPRSLMEAMDAGKPCIVSNIRGNKDLVKNGIGGYLIEPNDIAGYVNAIAKLIDDESLRRTFGKNNQDSVKKYSFKNVKQEMKEIYKLSLPIDR